MFKVFLLGPLLALFNLQMADLTLSANRYNSLSLFPMFTISFPYEVMGVIYIDLNFPTLSLSLCFPNLPHYLLPQLRGTTLSQHHIPELAEDSKSIRDIMAKGIL